MADALTADRLIGRDLSEAKSRSVTVGTGLSLGSNTLSADSDSPGAVNEENIELGQVHLTTTTATNVLQAAANEAWLIRQMIITNTAGAVNTISLYHDKDGTTYDNTTVLIKGATLATGGIENIDDIIIPLENSTGSIGLSTNKSDLTVTFWGIKLAESANTYKMLAQAQATTTATALYTLPANKKAVITGVVGANLTSATKKHSLYWDKDGTAYTTPANEKDHAVHYELPIAGDEYILFAEKKWLLEDTGGSIGDKGDTNNDINITVYGQEDDV